MSLGHTLFFTFVASFVLMLTIGYWFNKLSKGLSLLGYFLVYLGLAVAVFLFLSFAPVKLITISWCICLGLVVLTLIINQISQ